MLDLHCLLNQSICTNFCLITPFEVKPITSYHIERVSEPIDCESIDQ
jgi:hypothetical protein